MQTTILSLLSLSARMASRNEISQIGLEVDVFHTVICLLLRASWPSAPTRMRRLVVFNISTILIMKPLAEDDRRLTVLVEELDRSAGEDFKPIFESESETAEMKERLTSSPD